MDGRLYMQFFQMMCDGLAGIFQRLNTVEAREDAFPLHGPFGAEHKLFKSKFL